MYNEYIKIFIEMYDRMTGKYKRYISECLQPSQIEQLEEKAFVTPLKLPGDDLFKESLADHEFGKAKANMSSEQNF